MDISLKVLSALFLIALLTSEFVDCEVFEDDEPAHDRSEMLQKRGSADFGFMIWQVTGKPFTDYSSYGCYCGFGGKGRPLDAIDRCCKAHDQCWDLLTHKKICTRTQTIFLPYRFIGGRCLNGKYTYGLRCRWRRIWTWTRIWTRTRIWRWGWRWKRILIWRRILKWRKICRKIRRPSCAYHLCRCDLKAALCFKRNNRYYNKGYKSWQKSKC